METILTLKDNDLSRNELDVCVVLMDLWIFGSLKPEMACDQADSYLFFCGVALGILFSSTSRLVYSVAQYGTYSGMRSPFTEQLTSPGVEFNFSFVTSSSFSLESEEDKSVFIS